MPIGYGRLMLGSAVVSNSIGTQIKSTDIQTSQDYFYAPYTELSEGSDNLSTD